MCLCKQRKLLVFLRFKDQLCLVRFDPFRHPPNVVFGRNSIKTFFFLFCVIFHLNKFFSCNFPILLLLVLVLKDQQQNELRIARALLLEQTSFSVVGLENFVENFQHRIGFFRAVFFSQQFFSPPTRCKNVNGFFSSFFRLINI